MQRIIIACVCVVLAACSPPAAESHSKAFFVGQSLYPAAAPMYLIAGTGTQRVCRLWGRESEVRIVYRIGDQISAEVTKEGEIYNVPASPSVAIRQSDGVRECEAGEIVLITPVDLSGFTDRSL